MSDQSLLFSSHLGTQANGHLLPLEPVSDPFKDPKHISFFAILFYVMLSSMYVRQKTVMIESKDIQLNANDQNSLNNQNADIHFYILPPNATNGEINSVQTKNQQFAALRENLQNCLITARQNAEVMMTQTSTNVNLLQQNASEDTGWLQTLKTIFEVIDEITQRT